MRFPERMLESAGLQLAGQVDGQKPRKGIDRRLVSGHRAVAFRKTSIWQSCRTRMTGAVLRDGLSTLSLGGAEMLACPHCSAPIDLREIRHEGLLATHRFCPVCKQPFEVDTRTKKRQALFLVILLISLVLTVLSYIYGRTWAPFAVASYFLAGGVLYYGNRNVQLVKSPWNRMS